MLATAVRELTVGELRNLFKSMVDLAAGFQEQGVDGNAAFYGTLANLLDDELRRREIHWERVVIPLLDREPSQHEELNAVWPGHGGRDC